MSSTTLKDLRQGLKDRYESVPFWADDEARRGINEALSWWNLLTGTWKKRVVFGLPRETHWIALPTTLVYGARMQVDETPLDQTSIFDLDYGRPGWQGEFTTSGGSIPTKPRVWAPAGLTLFAIWPADTIGCHSLVIDGVHWTPRLVNDADEVRIDEDDRFAILGEALHIVAFKEGGERWKATEGLHRAFLEAAVKENEQIARSAYYRRYLGLDRDRRFDPARVPVEAN